MPWLFWRCHPRESLDGPLGRPWPRSSRPQVFKPIITSPNEKSGALSPPVESSPRALVPQVEYFIREAFLTVGATLKGVD